GASDVFFGLVTQLTALDVQNSNSVTFSNAVTMPGSISITAGGLSDNANSFFPIDVLAGATIQSTSGSVAFTALNANTADEETIRLADDILAANNITLNGSVLLDAALVQLTATSGDVTIN